MYKIAIKRDLLRRGYADYTYKWTVAILRKPQTYWQPVYLKEVMEDDQKSRDLYTLLTELGIVWDAMIEHPMLVSEATGMMDAIGLSSIAATI